jgi:SAM-dependent methyltransferase
LEALPFHSVFTAERSAMATASPAPARVPTEWEAIATTRWGSYITEIELRAIRLAHSLVGTPSRALEVGCDGGRWSKAVADLGWANTCIDISKEALLACQTALPNALCILARPEDRTLPCENSSYPLVLCVEVPWVIHSGWFAGEANRVLSTDGVLVGVAFNKRSLRALISGRPEYYTQTYDQWRAQIRENGFTLLMEEGCCWFPFSRGSNSRLVRFCTWLEEVTGLRKVLGLSGWIVFAARKTGPARA